MEVINVGISEYVIDQYQIFKKFHDQAVVGEGMRHLVPIEKKSQMPKWIYSYKFFFWLSYYNGYWEENKMVYDGLLDIILIKKNGRPFMGYDLFQEVVMPGITDNRS